MMKRQLLKVIPMIMAFILALSLTSCKEKNREYDAAEVAAAAKELIAKSELLDDIYFGKGIPADEFSTSPGTGYYKPANFVWLEQNGFSTINELKKMTTDVYTIGRSEEIFASALGGISGADGLAIEVFSRYTQKYVNNIEGGEEECILVNTNPKYEPIFTAKKNTHLYDTLVVTESVGERVYVTIDVLVETESGTKTVNQTIALIEEANGWRLDNSTFAN